MDDRMHDRCCNVNVLYAKYVERKAEENRQVCRPSMIKNTMPQLLETIMLHKIDMYLSLQISRLAFVPRAYDMIMAD